MAPSIQSSLMYCMYNNLWDKNDHPNPLLVCYLRINKGLIWINLISNPLVSKQIHYSDTSANEDNSFRDHIR
jgi:hypothetical protein